MTLAHLLLIPLAAQSLELPGAEELGAAIDGWAAAGVEAEHLSGSLLVAHGGEVVVERHWGWANREHRVSCGPTTRYCIASISKPVTGAIAIRLGEQERLALTDTLDRFAPEFPRGSEITVEMLLRHRAGIPHRPVDIPDRMAPRTAAEVLAAAADEPLTFDPGSDSSYSTGGYSVLARVLEIAGGADYGALVAREIAGPAGLTVTSDPNDREVLPGRATSYVFGPGGFRHAELQDTSYLVGGGSLYSNARDVHRFGEALLRGRLGERARERYARRAGYRWNGVTDGFRAFADHHLQEDLWVVWTGNVHSGATDALRAAIPALARGDDIPPLEVPEVAAEPLTRSALERAEGEYQLRPGSNLTVRALDGALLVNDWLLLAQSDTEFFSPQDYGRVRLRLSAQGAVEGLDWEQGGRVTEMPKVN